MEQCEPRWLSFDRLAQQCLEHPRWPKHPRPQVRSLAALFSKFDRGIELEWLQDRPEVQRVLEHQLQCSADQLALHLPAARGLSSSAPRRLRLDDAHALRALQLDREPLPPGLPPRLLDPNSWRREVWCAASSVEVDWVCRWLAARDLAATCRLSEAPLPVKTDLPLFVWAEHLPDAALSESLAAKAGVCVAVLQSAVASATIELPWRALESPPVLHWVAPFAHWASARFAEPGRVAPQLLLAWLERAAREGVVDGPHAALSLASAVYEVDPARSDWAWPQFVEHWLQIRLRRAASHAPHEVRWLTQHANQALLAVMDAVLLDGAAPWHAPRPEPEWQRLVPRTLQQSLDVEWTRLTLERSQSASASDLQAALAHTATGAARLVRALQNAGVLQLQPAARDAKLSWAPRWLGLWLVQQCQARVLQGSLAAWGAALLRPALADGLREQLRATLQQDPGAVLSQLHAPDAQDLAEVLAAETVFLLSGQTLLAGAALSPELCNAAWRAQTQLWVQLDAERLTPRVLCAQEDNAAFGAWLLACWALSENTPHALGYAALVPWAQPDVIPRFALDAVFEALKHHTEAAWWLGGWQLVLRLCQRAALNPDANAAAPGNEPGAGLGAELHPLLQPYVLLQARSWLPWARVTRVNLELALRLQTDERAAWLQRVWNLWWQHGADPEVWFTQPHSPVAGLLWRELPVKLLAQLFSTQHPFAGRLPYPALSSAHYGYLLLTEHPWTSLGLQHVPEQLLDAAIAALTQQKNAAGLGVLWARFAHAMPGRLQAAAQTAQWGTCAALFESAPRSALPELMPWLQAQLNHDDAPDALPLVARSWLQKVASHPGLDRQQAFALLADIERALKELPGG